ncbi:MAG: Mov34/MPN/PAD-1 family protein [Methylobacter sp.]
MTQQQIQIPRKLANQLLQLAQLSPDFEVCGIISSKNGIPHGCYPITNIAEQPQQRFLLDPSQQIAAMATMRESGEELFAIYHSHPTAPAIPSQTDVALASYPDAFHLIISLNTKGILEMRGFKITQQSTQELALSLANDELA